MNLLLDTNVLLHAAAGKLSQATVSLMQDSGNTCYYSLAGIWEIVIKTAKGKLDIGRTPEQFERALRANGYRRLDIKPAHLYGLAELEEIHSNPFDRVMVSQARCESMTLLTADKLLQTYPVPVILI